MKNSVSKLYPVSIPGLDGVTVNMVVECEVPEDDEKAQQKAQQVMAAWMDKASALITTEKSAKK